PAPAPPPLIPPTPPPGFSPPPPPLGGGGVVLLFVNQGMSGEAAHKVDGQHSIFITVPWQRGRRPASGLARQHNLQQPVHLVVHLLQPVIHGLHLALEVVNALVHPGLAGVNGLP
ncbi:MAG: hypothetical protein F4Z75_03570, partial [Synechococcus sp. SB0668_bin_15]|nr:hypothetical protein [Synechococcus sp. SB0668_bin_15]